MDDDVTFELDHWLELHCAVKACIGGAAAGAHIEDEIKLQLELLEVSAATAIAVIEGQSLRQFYDQRFQEALPDEEWRDTILAKYRAEGLQFREEQLKDEPDDAA